MPARVLEQELDEGVVSGVGALGQLAAPPGRERLGGVPAKGARGAVAVVPALEDAKGVTRPVAELHWQVGVEHHLTLVAPPVQHEQSVQLQAQPVQHERAQVAQESPRRRHLA